VIAILAGYIARAIVTAIRRAATMAGRLAGGDLTTRLPEAATGEIGSLDRSFNIMARSLQANRDDLTRLLEEQAALRSVATLVARGVPPAETFAAVSKVVQNLGAAVTDLQEVSRGIHPAILSRGALGRPCERWHVALPSRSSSTLVLTGASRNRSTWPSTTSRQKR
jgi:methyl-accepting chemotaxis protein